MDYFDIVIVGSGAGLMVAEAAITSNKKCAIIEKSKFGGTCLTKGCIPSKMLVYPADMIRTYEKSSRIGLSFGSPEVDWETISKRMWNQIDYNKAIEQSLKQSENLRIYNGEAEFTGKDKMRVRLSSGGFSDEIRGGIFVIANGSRSFIPPIHNLERTGYITSETFFGDKFPQKPWSSLIIVGGGAIGAEFAHIFSALGTKVTVIEMQPHILPTEEEEISRFVETEFKNNRIDLMTNCKVISSEKKGDMKSIIVENLQTGKRETVEAQEIFIASGVFPNNDILRLENTEIETDKRGWIKTNEYLETTQKNVYAIGDTNGKYQLRHKANYEAEVLIHNLFSGESKKRKACYNAVPWAVFTWPQVAHVGITEREARESGKKYWIGRNYYSRIASGIAMGIGGHSSDDGFVKIIVGEEKNILGVHIVGPHASILLQPFVYLMNANYKCEKGREKRRSSLICPQLGSYTPIVHSMVIHPSFNELTAWVLENINWQDERWL
ncbi:MAG: dihydrolipoyl dehydrogenase [Clostridiales bacterium]|nr:dihydrolipoyl dehydrogenase [Clostridiales bacterium]